MRKRIYEIIEVAEGNDQISRIYDVIIMLTIIMSLIPMTVKDQQGWLLVVDHTTVSIFVFDYVLRLITADYKYDKPRVFCVFVYPISI